MSGRLNGDLHVLVNAAGIGSFTSTPDTDLRKWEDVFASSIGVSNRAAYCASKGAVLAFTRALAVDHARDGIRVNALSPGTTDTPWIDRVVADEGESRDDLAARQLIGRLGTAEEIADAALDLASPQAGFTTGADLVVDGGATAR